MKRFHPSWVCVPVIVVVAICVLRPHLNADESQKLIKQAPPRVQKAIPGERKEKSLLANFMRAKLTASGLVLEGLCTEDFDLIAKGAKNLKKLSSAEKWRVSNDVMFRQHSEEFRAGVDRLLKAAEKKQIDAAALAWTGTTLNCIECHRWVRATLIADDPQFKLRLPDTARLQQSSR